jgi:hypothetical protein
MSGSKRIGKAGAAARAASDQVRQAAARVKPYASGARAAAGRGTHRARAVAAPRVERAGHALEDSVAPRVSAVLSSAARRLEPVKPQRRRLGKLAGISLVAAAASAAAAVFRNRAKPDKTAPADGDSDSAAAAAEMRDEKAGTSADAGVDGQVRTS